MLAGVHLRWQATTPFFVLRDVAFTRRLESDERVVTIAARVITSIFGELALARTLKFAGFIPARDSAESLDTVMPFRRSQKAENPFTAMQPKL